MARATGSSSRGAAGTSGSCPIRVRVRVTIDVKTSKFPPITGTGPGARAVTVPRSRVTVRHMPGAPPGMCQALALAHASAAVPVAEPQVPVPLGIMMVRSA